MNTYQQETGRLNTFKADLKDTGKMYRRLAYLLDSATESERSEGLDWYEREGAWCRELATHYNHDPLTICAVVSALSPSVSWTQNKIDTIGLLRAQNSGETDPAMIPASTYGAQIAKALKIAWTQDIQYIGNGLKTVSFALNLAGIQDASAVTIDRHMLGAAVGSRSTLHQRIAMTDKRYFAISDAVKRLASNRGILPKQVQAIVWTTYRRRIGLS